MLNIVQSTCICKNGQIVCVASVSPNNNYSSANKTIAIDATCKIYHNNTAYPDTGDTASGVPAIKDTHFYYPAPQTI